MPKIKKPPNYVFGGDGGNRTHVQKYRHLSVYERSRYIHFSLFTRPIDRLCEC